jgi:hypothetical protein
MEGKDHIIDEQLDAALKAYGAAEPRAGLEGRILANLRAERGRVTAPAWRWWPVLLAVASMLLVGTAVLLKTKARPARLATVTTGVATVPAAKEVATAHGDEVRVGSPSRARHRENRVVTSAPRLEQFPSPRPLSKQEKLLARYIERFPREAVLVARAQTELMRQETLEQGLPAEEQVSTDSQMENR